MLLAGARNGVAESEKKLSTTAGSSPNAKASKTIQDNLTKRKPI